MSVSARLVAGALGFLLLSPSFAAAQEVTRVEEDWEVYVIEPSADVGAPQFSVYMTPSQTDQSRYFVFELNHSTEPEFSTGGMQIQAWNNNAVANATGKLANHQLNNRGEWIRWTQSIQVVNDDVHFWVSGLQSRTWFGRFHEAEMVASLPANGQKNLNLYSIQNSIDDAKIGFASNRISTMKLVKVRAYSGNQLLGEVDVNHDVVASE